MRPRGGSRRNPLAAGRRRFFTLHKATIGRSHSGRRSAQPRDRSVRLRAIAAVGGAAQECDGGLGTDVSDHLAQRLAAAGPAKLSARWSDAQWRTGLIAATSDNRDARTRPRESLDGLFELGDKALIAVTRALHDLAPERSFCSQKTVAGGELRARSSEKVAPEMVPCCRLGRRPSLLVKRAICKRRASARSSP